MRDHITEALVASASVSIEDELTSKRSLAGRRNTRPTIGYLVSEIQRDFALWPWRGMVDAARQHDVKFITFIGGILRPLIGFGGQANVLCDLARVECWWIVQRIPS